MKKLLTLAVCIISLQLSAQEKNEKWDLIKCVNYARANNISLKQADIQARISALQLKQAKLNQYPSASLSSGQGLQLGRSIDHTTNVYSNTQAIYQNIGLNSGIGIYNWGRLKNSVAVAQFNAEAALVDIDKAANDLALNVATYYLQILSAKEQININELQASQTRAQVDITRKQVDAGALPELNLVELEAQLAIDSSNIISAKSLYQQNILSLKGLLNIDAAQAFDIVTPPVETIPVEPLASLNPELV